MILRDDGIDANGIPHHPQAEVQFDRCGRVTLERMRMPNDSYAVRRREAEVMKRRVTASVLGGMAGFVAALVIMNHADSALGAAILLPFGLLGFVFGNVHQGSDVITLVSLTATSVGIGAAVGYVLVRKFASR